MEEIDDDRGRAERERERERASTAVRRRHLSEWRGARALLFDAAARSSAEHDDGATSE